MLALTRPFLTGLLGLFSIFLALPCWAGSSVTRTWEDLGAGDFVDYDKPSGAHFLEGAEVRESANVGACSGLRYLAKRALANALSDPGPLTLMFDGPRSAVSVCVGNPDGKVPREISLQGYSASDAGKPVAIARITLPPGTPFSQTLTVCRLLDHDLVRVELWYGGDALEIIDDLRVDAVDGSTYRISFEEHPAGTLVESQYAGVRFPSRPEIVTSKALGVGTRSESQALRQRLAGETDLDPMILDFQPSQGAVRFWTGYPPAEQQSGALRITLRAFASGAQGWVEVASDELDLAQVTPVNRVLEVCRIDHDIARVEVRFESPLGGHEVIEDLEFGPCPVPVVPDLEAPVIRMTSPADQAVIPQPSSRPEHRTTTVTLRGVIVEDRALNSFRVQVMDEAGNVDFDDGGLLRAVSGAAPDFAFEIPILLKYGASLVRLSATDATGQTTTLDHHLSYLGPPPVELTGAFPVMGYPAIVFREASASGPAISNPPPVVRLTGRNLNPELRYYLAAESRATIPPSAPDLIEATVTSRGADADADWVDLRIPDAVLQNPGSYGWLVWDLWSRPGQTVWSRGGDFEARSWPYAALWSLGFGNRDETNDIGDFEAVFGEEVLPGFLEPSTPIDGCNRGVNSINFFWGRYLPTLNTPGAGGSCFGFAAASQLFAVNQWSPTQYDPAVRLPSGFRSFEPMRFAATGCDPQVPVNLWATIQTLFGIHTSYEFLDAWNDQVQTVDGGAMVGDPTGLAEAIRDFPVGYVLGFTPAGSNIGHAVAPYRVENRDANTIRLWVLDSNFPYDPAQAEGALVNQVAVNRFIDVDRRSNTFRFAKGASSDALAEFQSTNVWVGSAIAAIPLSIFQNPRTIPMMDYLAEQYFGVTGDVAVDLEFDGGGTWGWDERGGFHGNQTGLRLVPSFADGDPSANHPLVLIPTNHSRVAVSLGGKDPAHHLVVGNGGVIFGVRRRDRAVEFKDFYELSFEDGRPGALRFVPGSPAARWTPELGLVRTGDGELLYRFHGLGLGGGQSLRLEALADERGVRVGNESTEKLSFHVELAAGSVKSANERRWFGPFQLPAGAVLDLVPSRWPAIDGVEARLDEDQNGVPESVAVAPGLAIDLKPGDDGDCNRNGVLDALDVATGTSVDANGNGIPDECTALDTGGAGGGGTSGTSDCSVKGEQLQSFATIPDGPLPADAFGLLRVTSPAVIREGLLVAVPPVEIGGVDPGTLALQFDCARGLVALEVVNSSKTASVRARAWAYAASDSTKPVSQAEAMVPPNTVGGVVLSLCRPLEEDISRVVLEFEGTTPETVRSVLHATRADRQVLHYDFEDRPAGTAVLAQYPGVTFPDRPLVTLAAALGVGAGSGVQVLRKVPNDTDTGPLILRFDPPQAEVRLSVGYPASENDGRPLRVTLRAFDGTKGSATLIATNEVVMSSPRTVNRVLSVMRCAADIHEVQVQFVDRPSGGLEVIDDLEFGPVPLPTAEPDTTAPALRVVSPASGTVLSQLDPTHSTGATNLVVEITEARALDHVVVVIRDSTGAVFRRLVDSEIRLTGAAPRYTLQAVAPLAYGTNWVEVQAVDISGNEGNLALSEWLIVYRGPEPVSLLSSSPVVLYPEDLVRNALPSRPREFPEVRLPRTVVTLQGAHFNRLVRVHAVAEDEAQVPPRAGTLIPAELVSRNEAGTELQVRLDASLWNDLDVSQGRRLRWVLEDAWTRPDRVTWTLGDRFVVRQRPWPMTYGFGFVNVEGPNTLTDFDGVFGLNAYLSWTDHCWRDPIYLGFYEWGYSVTLNRSPGGSCYGFVAASQSIYNQVFDPAWLNSGFIDQAVLPAGRWETGPIRENNPSCGPRSPSSLWAWIQTFHGMQQSEEHLYQQLNQIVQHGGVWRGNIGARLGQLGPRPYDFMLCMKPRNGTTGHCVLPYRIESLNDRITRVWVYDPNYPYRHFLPEDHPANIRSVYSYVDFDPVANNYMFDLDASFDTNNVEVVRNHFHAGTQWSGEGLSVTLLPLGDRTMPGLGYGIDYLFSTVAGDAQPQYSNAAGQRWGWNEDGSRVEEMDGVHPFTPFTFAGDETDQVSLLSRASNAWRRVAIRARGTNYQFMTGGGGVLFGIRNPGATPGTVDHAEQRLADGGPRAVRFESERPNERIDPFMVMPESPGQRTNHVIWRWRDLHLPAAMPWVMEADPTLGHLGARNEGETPIVARLIRERAGVEGPETTDYGLVTIPAGGAVRFVPLNPESIPTLREDVDADGDGVFERTLTVTPTVTAHAPSLAAGRVDLAKKRIRLRIREAARADVTVERSTDLVHWEVLATEPAPDNADEVEAPMDAGVSFFRVRRLP